MESIINKSDVDEIVARFRALNSLVPLSPIRSGRDYDKRVAILNQLLDAGGANERSPIAGLVNALGSVIADYDAIHHPIPAATPSATLQFLMDQHQLKQSDLPEVGTQGVISEILSGKRELNLRQIKALAARFHVPVQVFIAD
jgi:HTH-type transcriptional regulator / antitoxin HigA